MDYEAATKETPENTLPKAAQDANKQSTDPKDPTKPEEDASKLPKNPAHKDDVKDPLDLMDKSKISTFCWTIWLFLMSLLPWPGWNQRSKLATRKHAKVNTNQH